jgi:hypothetical protein
MRFDLTFRRGVPRVEPHYCRVDDCHGMDESHGMSVQEACVAAAEWHEEQARLYRSGAHPDVMSYRGNIHG